MIRWAAITGFGLGHSPVASGTTGSAGAIAIALVGAVGDEYGIPTYRSVNRFLNIVEGMSCTAIFQRIA